MQIEPEIKEYCSIKEALEYLAFGLKPCKGDDRWLVNDDILKNYLKESKTYLITKS